jgi:DNA invertase Pin-like site-specific DNA recombinase
MMTAITMTPDDRLTPARRAKLAYIYVRQSSVTQVKHHQESTELQYRLVDRAIALGWPRERVQVIDEDLGKSGAGHAERQGFQKLIAEIGLGNAGLVISLDASRLARNNRDWHQLLELCSLFGVIIADGERLYDPSAYHDRLLLGLSGIMSEAELHQIRMRLHQGELQKAARGELRLPLPGGLIYDRSGQIVLNPDEEVQARLRLVFAKFQELQSARAVMLYLRRNALGLPVRPLVGPSPHELVWREASACQVRYILQNPAYAGAYVYGRRRVQAGCRSIDGRMTASVKVPLGEWKVCLPSAHPGYIGWEEFMANQRRLSDNANGSKAGRRGVARKGMALLQGIAVCGRCGRRMSVRYSGPNNEYPVYCCRADKDQTAVPLCQEVRAGAVDDLIAEALLEALAPDQIGIAIAAVDQMAQETRQLESQWSLRRERARYEAERAHRQYDAVEPENRLVARSLERVWEERLRAVDAVEQDYRQWRQQDPVVLKADDIKILEDLASNLPSLWHSPTTRPEERKRILRFIVQEVLLDQKRTRGEVWVKIVWQTGAVSEHRLWRRVHSYNDDYADIEGLRRRITDLNTQGLMDKQIAAILNEEGVVSARRRPFTYENVWVLRQRWNLPAAKLNPTGSNPPRWPDGSYSVQGAAAAIGVTPQVIFHYLASGLLTGRQLTKGQPWQIDLTTDKIDQLQHRLLRTRRSKRKAS